MATYYEVKALKDLFEKDEDDARWQENLRKTGVDGDLDVGVLFGVDGGFSKEFEEDALEDVVATYYNFMGDPGGGERFYAGDNTVYKSADGKLWVEESNNLFEF